MPQYIAKPYWDKARWFERIKTYILHNVIGLGIKVTFKMNSKITISYHNCTISAYSLIFFIIHVQKHTVNCLQFTPYTLTKKISKNCVQNLTFSILSNSKTAQFRRSLGDRACPPTSEKGVFFLMPLTLRMQIFYKISHQART